MNVMDENGDNAIDEDEIEPVFNFLLENAKDEEHQGNIAAAFDAIAKEDLNHDGKLTTQEIARAIFWLTDPWSPFK